ncbi:hypothetical protein D6T64_01365 [Cryobacterium melibiosiphilum]|uniref:Uncharacterized protein n=3 Tax=Cryobacterium melibiosiphilum TaxID=995039 RepID=A0A3A5MQZ1_9MICO|nr:hypothetical protein D6T64_01365 [Cryobacterium melibiosiphilum]
MLANALPTAHNSAAFADLSGIGNMTAMLGNSLSMTDYSAAFADLSGISQSMTATLTNALPKMDYSAAFADVSGIGNMTAMLGNSLSMKDYSAAFADLSGITQSMTAMLANALPKTDYSAAFGQFSGADSTSTRIMTDIANARLLTLERGFMQGTGTATDFFGELDTVVGEDRKLNDHVRRAVATTQRVGSFGLDFNSVRREAAELADRFDSEPDLERTVRSALEPVQDLTGLTDEVLIEYGEFLGWWTRITRHKISTAGIIFGFTAGLVSYIASQGSGSVAAPSAVVDAIILGGGIYAFMHGDQTGRAMPLN